jgi:uncharacterized membrane protein YidH (DUF202 family)
MDNTEATTKPEGKKAVIGWLFILVAVGIVAYMAWSWWSQKRAVNKQMAKVRSFREKDDKPASDV